MLNDVSRIPPGDEVLLCGDYNAYTNTLPDYNIGDIKITGSNGDLDKLLTNDIEHRFNDISTLYMQKRLGRASMDNKPINSHGTQLIDLCKAGGLLILNGRAGKDRNVGNFTRDDTTGRSVIDYVIATPHLFEGIHEFQIGDKFPESDHLPIEFSVKCGSKTSGNVTRQHKSKWGKQRKIRWTKSDLPLIKAALTDDTAQPYLNNFNDALVCLSDTNTVALAFNEYVSQAVTGVCTTIETKRKTISGPKWYDYEYRLLRSDAVQAGGKVNNETERKVMLDKCKKYRACKQRKQREYKKDCMIKIESAYYTNKANMWSVLDNVCRKKHDS